MIISNDLKFIFIHNPKCGGTSVRAALETFHTGDLPWGEVHQHPLLGQIDYGHIPLQTLRDYFPEEFALFQAFRSYAIVRNPQDRFISSLSQQMRLQGITTADQRAMQSYSRQAEAVVKRIDTSKGLLEHDIIHFTRQTEFIEMDGVTAVDVIVPLERIDNLLKDLHAYTLGQVQETINKKGETLVYRSSTAASILHLLRLAINLNSGLIPDSIRRVGRKALYISPSELEWRKLSSDIQNFVFEYYRDDFRLHQTVLEVGMKGTTDVS